MVLNDILTLVKAGYTRDEIAQMEQQETPNANPVPVPAPAAEPEPTPQPVNTPTQVAEPVSVPVAQPVPQPQQTEPTMAELMQAVAKLTSAVQANAIAQSVIPGGLTQPTPTAEDMLAEIIRPTFKAREEK